MTQIPREAAEVMREAAIASCHEAEVSDPRSVWQAACQAVERKLRDLRPLPDAPSEPTAEGQEALPDDRFDELATHKAMELAYHKANSLLTEYRKVSADLARMNAAMETETSDWAHLNRSISYFAYDGSGVREALIAKRDEVAVLKGNHAMTIALREDALAKIRNALAVARDAIEHPDGYSKTTFAVLDEGDRALAALSVPPSQSESYQASALVWARLCGMMPLGSKP